MTKMRAWVARAYGEPKDVLRLEVTDRPEASGKQLLVKVHYSSLNPIDLRMTRGYGRNLRKLVAPKEFPVTFGRDFVGEVIALGPEVARFEAGRRVVGITGPKEPGAFAEYVAVDESHAVSAPANVGSRDLAAIAYVGLTTWTALVTRAGLDPNNVTGKRIFIHAGSGGVGSFAVQWARALGMEVITTCGPSNVDWVRALGASRVVNYAEEDYRKVVGPVDFAYDTLGGEYATDTLNLVKPGGAYVSIVHPVMPYTDAHGVIIGGMRAAGRLARKKTLSKVRRRTYAWSICKPNADGLSHIVGLVSENRIRAVVEHDMPMEEIVEGYGHLATGRTKGKIVLGWR